MMADFDFSEILDSMVIIITLPENREKNTFLMTQMLLLHVAKVVLIDASPVFKKMLTNRSKRKNACTSRLEIQRKDYSSFEMFLRCSLSTKI